jgi:hypothetical protein
VKKININELSKEYCKSHNIPDYDSYMVLNEIKSIIEIYFDKQIYLTNDSIKFVENDKKISISENLIKDIRKNLTSFISAYIKNNTHLKNNYDLQFSVQKCTVYKKTEHGFYLSFLDKYAFISKIETYPLVLGEKYYLFIEKYNKEKNLYKALMNHHKVAQVVIDGFFGKNKFKINAYKANYILSLLYEKEKPTKEDIKRMRIFFKKEKIIYNKRDK